MFKSATSFWYFKIWFINFSFSFSWESNFFWNSWLISSLSLISFSRSLITFFKSVFSCSNFFILFSLAFIVNKCSEILLFNVLICLTESTFVDSTFLAELFIFSNSLFFCEIWIFNCSFSFNWTLFFSFNWMIWFNKSLFFFLFSSIVVFWVWIVVSKSFCFFSLSFIFLFRFLFSFCNFAMSLFLELICNK